MITSSYAVRKRQSASAETPWWLSGGTIDAANAIAVYQPKGAASLAASYTNLANPGTNDLTAPSIAPSFDIASGWEFTGSLSQYLSTGIATDTGWSFIVRFSGLTSTDLDSCLYGDKGGSTYYIIAPNYSGGYIRYYVGFGGINIAPALLSGVVATAGGNFYRNGVADGFASNGFSSGTDLVIGGYRDAGSVYGRLKAYIQAVAIYDTTLTSDQVAAVSTAMAALETPWWLADGTIDAANAIAVYQPKGAASLAASYVNLANPGTYDAAPGTAPTFNTATGWTFNGSTQYLSTGVVPENDQTWSMIVRYSGMNGVQTTCIAGLWEGSLQQFCIQQENAEDIIRFGNGGIRASAGFSSSGVAAFAGSAYYRDGTQIDTNIPSGSIPITLGVSIGARTRSSSVDLYFDGGVLAVAIYDTTLTSDQVAAVSTAMAAL